VKEKSEKTARVCLAEFLVCLNLMMNLTFWDKKSYSCKQTS